MHFRDRKTGRFVSRSTWKRSHAQGGKRYKREPQKPARKRKKREITPPPPPATFAFRVKYKKDSKRFSGEVVISGLFPNENAALDAARKMLAGEEVPNAEIHDFTVGKKKETYTNDARQGKFAFATAKGFQLSPR